MARKNRNRKTKAGVAKLESLTQGKTLWHVYLLPARDGSNTYKASEPQMIQLTAKPKACFYGEALGMRRYLSHKVPYTYYSTSPWAHDRSWATHNMSGDCGVFPIGQWTPHNHNRTFTTLRQALRYIRLYDGTPMSQDAIDHQQWMDEMDRELDRMTDSEYDNLYDEQDIDHEEQ